MAKYPFYYVLNSVGSDSVCECKGVCKCSPSSMNSSEELQLISPGVVVEVGSREVPHIPSLDVECMDPHELDKLSLWNPQLQRCWEVQDSDTVPQGQVLNIKGRLKASAGFGVEILQTSFPVVNCIQEGYKLPLIREPMPFIQANHKSALEHSQFVTDVVKELLDY